MELVEHGRMRRVADGLATAIVIETPARKTLHIERALAGLLGELADVPHDDVDLDFHCAECGQRHGPPSVVYPSTPSGGSWYAHAVAAPPVTVAAASTLHPLGVAVQPLEMPRSAQVDEAAFHPEERRVIAKIHPHERVLTRARYWVRKAALIEACGHTGVVEPARIALSQPDDSGEGRVMLASHGLPAGATGARIIDIEVPDGFVAALALLD